MMSAEDGWVPRQVIEIIHYDGNEQIQHLETMIKSGNLDFRSSLIFNYFIMACKITRT